MLVIGSKVLRIEAFCGPIRLTPLLFYTPGESANLFGMAIAFISGITYAAYIIALYRSCLREISPFLFSFYMCLESAVLLLAGLLLAGQFTLPATALGWFATLGLAVAASIVGVVLFQIGVSLIGPQNASILHKNRNHNIGAFQIVLMILPFILSHPPETCNPSIPLTA